ncbi:MAG: Maltose/maltodextrin import ATP-binding protein MalK [Anaerolineales bacterium]|nr:Maltose/maltodextrin import ATP-binding protein MalK [Anaerolineales bacterium]
MPALGLMLALYAMPFLASIYRSFLDEGGAFTFAHYEKALDLYLRDVIFSLSVLLLDEPLSNLDAQLREEMRFEIRELQKQLGITSIYVTHDQAEALVLSDRIAVLHRGKMVQVGTPDDIYNRPSNRFVAGFIGLTSFIEGSISGFDETTGHAIATTKDDLTIEVDGQGLSPGQSVTLSIRPEHLRLSRDSHAAPAENYNVLEGKVHRAAYLGDVVDYRIQVRDWELRAHSPTDEALSHGEHVFIIFSPEHVTVIPK